MISRKIWVLWLIVVLQGHVVNSTKLISEARPLHALKSIAEKTLILLQKIMFESSNVTHYFATKIAVLSNYVV